MLRLPVIFCVSILAACGGGKADESDAPLGFEDVSADTQNLSDSQSFETITAQESIETDADRLARLSNQYVQYRATPLPERDEDARVDLTAYAERYAKRRIGKKRYSRERNPVPTRVCQTLPSNDYAQFVFLSKGGPKEDHLGLDDDGDGFACGWRP